MRLVLTGRHLEITPAVRRLVDRKIDKLIRVLNDGIVSAQVVLTKQKYRNIAEVILHARGDHILKGIGETDAWETSLSSAVEKIAQQAQKVKGKWQERKRRATPVKQLPPKATDGDEERPPRVVRATRYPVKPMTVDEAALAVEKGPDTFLVFRNASTESINVVYRRKDGNLGLIEPED